MSFIIVSLGLLEVGQGENPDANKQTKTQLSFLTLNKLMKSAAHGKASRWNPIYWEFHYKAHVPHGSLA